MGFNGYLWLFEDGIVKNIDKGKKVAISDKGVFIPYRKVKNGFCI